MVGKRLNKVTLNSAKIKPIALVVVELCLSEGSLVSEQGVSESVSQ